MATDAVGFIGLGNMGQPLAGHLARSGVELQVFDIAGANEARTPAQTIGAAYRIIKAFKDADPSQDAMRIYPFVKGDGGAT